MHATPREHPDAGERAFIDKVVALQMDRPGALLGILEAVQDRNPQRYLPRCVMSQTRPILRWLAFTVSRRSTPSSIWSRRATTPFAFAGARPVIPAARAICWNAFAWN
jgi:hypothetical protein